MPAVRAASKKCAGQNIFAMKNLANFSAQRAYNGCKQSQSAGMNLNRHTGTVLRRVYIHVFHCSA